MGYTQTGDVKAAVCKPSRGLGGGDLGHTAGLPASDHEPVDTSAPGSPLCLRGPGTLRGPGRRCRPQPGQCGAGRGEGHMCRDFWALAASSLELADHGVALRQVQVECDEDVLQAQRPQGGPRSE